MEPKYYHHLVGANFRIDAMQAAVLRVKLPHLAGWSDGRRANAARYRALFADAGLSDVVLPVEAPDRTHIYNQFVIRVPGRDRLRGASRCRAASAPRCTIRCRSTCRSVSPTSATGPARFPMAEAAAERVARAADLSGTDRGAAGGGRQRNSDFLPRITHMELLKKIESKQARLGVIGLGYVGLPLAVEFARAGFGVVGYDVDERKVAELMAGRSYIPDVPSAHLAEVVKSGKFVATTDAKRLADTDIIDICVPTPLRKTKDPDMTYVVQAVEAVAAVLAQGPADHPRVDDLSGDDGRSGAADARREGLQAGRRFLPRVLARARRSGQSAVPDQEHSEGGRRHQRRQHAARGGVLRAGDGHASFR